jgi:hypothetical protein
MIRPPVVVPVTAHDPGVAAPNDLNTAPSAAAPPVTDTEPAVIRIETLADTTTVAAPADGLASTYSAT